MSTPGRTAAPIIAGSAVLVGGGSLLLFALFLFTGFPRLVDLGFEPAAALAWDAGLSLLFFLQHSGMVRRPVRARLERAVGEPLVGVVYTLASGVALLACLLLWQPVGESLVAPGPAAVWAGRLLFLAAIGGFVWAVRALGSFDTFGLEPLIDGLRHGPEGPRPLAVRGPYRWVRHPLYLFALVLFWSYPAITPDRLLFNLLWTGWVVVGTVLEERDLLARFGEAYEAYQRDVPMLLPRRLRPAPACPSHQPLL